MYYENLYFLHLYILKLGTALQVQCIPKSSSSLGLEINYTCVPLCCNVAIKTLPI